MPGIYSINLSLQKIISFSFQLLMSTLVQCIPLMKESRSDYFYSSEQDRQPVFHYFTILNKLYPVNYIFRPNYIPSQSRKWSAWDLPYSILIRRILVTDRHKKIGGILLVIPHDFFFCPICNMFDIEAESHFFLLFN